ncbi:hypothetical protein WN48_02185 [Eufriesea mexicana]|uniref:Uncharacterized protein n=1 Tax=Eufriesea mexicana TaxID=516756 RepID=A0A310SB05_9HYME|nr:hypothetical protein WN48_02185 [Eufriesea mexicana]
MDCQQNVSHVFESGEQKLRRKSEVSIDEGIKMDIIFENLQWSSCRNLKVMDCQPNVGHVFECGKRNSKKKLAVSIDKRIKMDIIFVNLEWSLRYGLKPVKLKRRGISNVTPAYLLQVHGLVRKDETQEVCSPCRTCKKSNHLEKDYYFKNMKKSKGDQGEKKKVCFLTENNGTKQWILDSRTTSHIVNKLEYLKE